MVSWGRFSFLDLGSDETIRLSRRGNRFANDLPGAFSCEVETGSRQENASNQESRAPFRFNRNGALGSLPSGFRGTRRHGRVRSFLRPQTRNTLYRPDDPVGGHPGPRTFLDLACGPRSIVDLDTLPEPQIDDVLLARNLFRHGWGCEYKQRATDKRHTGAGPNIAISRHLCLHGLPFFLPPSLWADSRF